MIRAIAGKSGQFVLAAILIANSQVLSMHAATADVNGQFEAANKLYAEGRHGEAAQVYEGLLAGGFTSPAILFNAGNAHFKANQIGKAIAAYIQAAEMTPRDPDIRANLKFARAQVQGPTLQPAVWQVAVATLSLREWSLVSAGGIWLSFGLLALGQMVQTIRRPLRNWVWAAFALTLLACAGLAIRYSIRPDNRLAIVKLTEATVRNSPFDESPTAFTAKDGAELEILDRKEGWLQVSDGGQNYGWIKSASVLTLPTSHSSEVQISVK